MFYSTFCTSFNPTLTWFANLLFLLQITIIATTFCNLIFQRTYLQLLLNFFEVGTEFYTFATQTPVTFVHVLKPHDFCSTELFEKQLYELNLLKHPVMGPAALIYGNATNTTNCILRINANA